MSLRRFFLSAFALLAAFFALAFTPKRVYVDIRIGVEPSQREAAVSALTSEITQRGGELVTSVDGRSSWYALAGTAIGFSQKNDSITINASRMRSPGCSQKSFDKYRNEVTNMVKNVVTTVSQKSGIRMDVIPLNKPASVP